MTKKDYLKFADVLVAANQLQNYGAYKMYNFICDNIEKIFAEDNPRFDRQRFEKYLGDRITGEAVVREL